ncbi:MULTISPECIES: zinc finger Ran-binding domain-containing protein [Amycolatopsis]|uniref:Zinc finger Ran-binding domain-containing protein n=1 Tax=Amycolatopsis albidoflavus TaxID=102226 RepID=A0ABW5IDU5_9PSEU
MPDKADWSCDSCHTNNYAQQSVCRVCGREAGSATGELALPDHRPLKIAADETVAFVDSKHTKTERPTIALAPVPPPRAPTRPPPAPKISSPGPRYAPRRRKRRVLPWLVLAVFGFLALVYGSQLLAHLSSKFQQPAQTTAATPCPAEAASWLSDSGAGLVAKYDTGKHTVTICVGSDGSYHYDGRVNDGQPTTADNHISLHAERTSSGFTAVNGEYSYEISGLDLTVRKRNKVIGREHLTPVH